MKKYELMALPYAPEALEPVISKETIGFHHGKHLQAYVDNLNKLASPPAPSPIGEGSLGEIETLEEIVRKAPAGPLFNNAGQILNHELYFLQFKPVGEAAQGPKGALAAQIEKQWGSVEAFKAEFEAKGVGLFGSGWVWLSADAEATADLRRLGACLLPGLSEPPRCSSRCPLADYRLGGY